MPNVVDPLGGCYFVESLTKRLEAAAEDYFAQIDALGGVVPRASSRASSSARSARPAYDYQKELEAGAR